MVIQTLKDQIEHISQKPLKRSESKSEDQLQLDNIHIRLKEDTITFNQHNFDNEDDDEGFSSAKVDVLNSQPDKKAVADMWMCIDQLDKGIKQLKDKTSLGLSRTKNELWRRLNQQLTTYKKELMADQLKQKETDASPFDKEQTLSKELEIMTQIA